MDRHLEPPLSYDQLLLTNNQLKTRVNELELINMMTTESEARLQKEIESIRKNEQDMKPHINQLEQALNDRDTSNNEDHHPAKRTRLSEPS